MAQHSCKPRKKNQLTVVKVLLAANAQVTWINKSNKYTPMHWAVENNNAEMVALLVVHKHHLRTYCKNGLTALKLAWHKKYWDCVLVFAKNISATDNIKDIYDTGAALLAATIANQTEVAIALLATNPKVDDFLLDDENLNWTLHWAVEHNNTILIIALLQAGASTSRVNIHHQTAMDFAVSLAHQACIDIFQNDLTAKRIFDAIASATPESFAEAKTLLGDNFKFQVKSNYKTDDLGQTSLHLASFHNQPELITLLLEAGASSTELNSANETPIQISLAKKHWDCIAVFVNNLVEQQNPQGRIMLGNVLVAAVREDRTDIALSIITKNPNVNSSSIDGMFCLHFAVQNKNQKLIKALIFAGANVHAHNGDDLSPLQIANAQDRRTRLYNRFRIFNRSREISLTDLINETINQKVAHDRVHHQAPARPPLQRLGRAS